MRLSDIDRNTMQREYRAKVFVNKIEPDLPAAMNRPRRLERRPLVRPATKPSAPRVYLTMQPPTRFRRGGM